MSSTPWAKIRAEWLKGGITHRELAKKYGVSVKTIQNRASNEGWKNEKGKIREKVEEATRERVTRARINQLEKLIETNDKLLDGLAAMAEYIKNNPRAYLRDDKRSLKNAEAFANAIKIATETQRDLHRIPNLDQRFAQKKWREQKKLEEQKLKGPEHDNEMWEIRAPEGVEVDG